MEKEELKAKSIRDMPETLWLRFVKRCSKRRVTVPGGLIEAITDWMNKHDD